MKVTWATSNEDGREDYDPETPDTEHEGVVQAFLASGAHGIFAIVQEGAKLVSVPIAQLTVRHAE